MEFTSAIVMAVLLIAGGGATGAVMLSDGGLWDGHHGMMGSGTGGMMGGYGEGLEDCPYHGNEECYAEDGEYPEECEEHYEDCPYHEGLDRTAQRGGGCC
jgi:hypothetical protein